MPVYFELKSELVKENTIAGRDISMLALNPLRLSSPNSSRRVLTLNLAQLAVAFRLCFIARVQQRAVPTYSRAPLSWISNVLARCSPRFYDGWSVARGKLRSFERLWATLNSSNTAGNFPWPLMTYFHFRPAALFHFSKIFEYRSSERTSTFSLSLFLSFVRFYSLYI